MLTAPRKIPIMDDEFFDDELGAALRGRAGSPTSTSAAYDAVVGRATSIRRRRGAIAGGGSLVVVLIGGLILLSGGNSRTSLPADGDRLPAVTPASVDEVSVPSTVAITVDTAATMSTVASDDTTSTTPTERSSVPVTTTGGVAGPVGGDTMPSTTVATTTGVTATTVDTPPTTMPGTTTPTTSTTPTTTAVPLAPFTETFSSAGGSITVNWNGSALSLVSADPAAGYTTKIEDNQADRVRVRFEGADNWRIEVRISNGQRQVTIS
jgi:hypothetical protein